MYSKFFSYIFLAAAFVSAAMFTSCKEDEAVKLSHISLNVTEVNLAPGASYQLEVTGAMPANAADKSVAWSSGSTGVATVDATTGMVSVSASATEGATAVITATANDGGGAKATCTITVRVKTVIVGAQDGVLREGMAGTVTYPVTTTNIEDGAFEANVANLPAGVTVQGQVTISGNTATLTLAGNTSTVAGATATLTLTIDGVTSAPFTLTIAEPGVKAVDVAAQNGTILGGVDGEATFAVTTANIADGQAGAIEWFADAAGTISSAAPSGISPAITNVANNAVTVTMTATLQAYEGAYYFRLTIDGATSAVATLTVSEGPGGTGVPDISWYNAAATEFTIYFADQLAGFAQLVNDETESFEGKTVKLGRNIDLSVYGQDFNDGKGWIPIGWSYSGQRTPTADYRNPAFKGTFDGAGHIVSKLFFEYRVQDEMARGLFGYVNGATITRLGIVISPSGITNHRYVGAVAGFAADLSEINNCYVAGEQSNTPFQIFSNDGSVSEYVAGGFVRGIDHFTGGMVGYLHTSEIHNCYITAEVVGNRSCGGILGGPVATIAITNCAALNSGILRFGSSGMATFGRIISQERDGLSNNVAFDEMTRGNNWSLGGTGTIGENLMNGADITKAQIAADGTIGGRFTTENGWTVENGKLPGFGAAIELPDYLK